MGFLKNLFNREENRKISVFDYFQIDIKELPDESFIDLGMIYDKDGLSSRVFVKTLDYLECGIFRDIKVLIYENSYDVEFSSSATSQLNVNKFCELANSLYKIYGYDSTEGGIVTRQEIIDYSQYGMIGRFWSQKFPWIFISACLYEDNVINLAIKGIPKEKLVE